LDFEVRKEKDRLAGWDETTLRVTSLQTMGVWAISLVASLAGLTYGMNTGNIHSFLFFFLFFFFILK
jgi:uncharacterized membrane protein